MRPNCLAYILFLSVISPRVGVVQIGGSLSPKTVQQTPEDPNTKEPYVFENINRRVRFEADGTGERDLTWRVRIQSESAVRQYGLIVYPYAASFESLEIVSVRARKPDGTVVETQQSEIQDLDTPVSRQAPMYTDEREKHIPVKSLAVGDVLEVHVRWTIHNPMAPGYFWLDHNYFRYGICVMETVQIDVPAKVPVKFRTSGPQPTVYERNGRAVYTFQNANPKKIEESKIPDWERYFHGAPPPELQITSFQSWEEIGKWFAALEQSKVVVTPQIRSKAEELIKGKATDDEKAQAIYDYVATRFRYIGIDLGVSRFEPHSATEVLTNHYGDCKDKHTLFTALLQAAGITAYPVLVSSSRRIDSDFPTISLFNHVITAIPRGDSFIFLDTTPEVAPFGFLLQNIRDRKALVIPDSAPARLVTTPADLPFPGLERIRVDSSIDSQGTLDAKIRLDDRGDGELSLRALYHATSQNRWDDLTQKIAAGLGFGGSVTEVLVAQPEDTHQPFWISFSYHRTDYPDWKEHRVTLPAPRIRLASLSEEQKVSKDSLPLGPVHETIYEASMKFPSGYRPVVPKNVEQKNDFAEFNATFSLEDDVLRGTYHFKTLVREIPGTERSQYTSLVKTIDDASRRWIFVGDNSHPLAAATAPSVSKGSESGTSPAQTIYEAAKRAERESNYAASAQLYEQVVATDPKYAEAWNSLGYVYGKLGQLQKEETAFRRALELDPTSRWAHYNLGNALMNQRKYGEAISEYQKEIDSKSNNSLVHLNLGRVYVLSGQPEKAIPELEMAANLMPTNTAVQFNLGLAYAKLNQSEKSAEAFNKSVELEPTAERKNSVAFEMALNKLQLDQAEKYADSAIEHIESQTKDTSLETLSNGDVRLPVALGAFWDTLGWIKFQQGNLVDAEKYTLSAWQIRSIGQIGDHLGQIYEKMGKKAEAVQMYSFASVVTGTMPETRTRLIALLGGEADLDHLIQEAHGTLAKNQTIEIKNTGTAEGNAEFWILLTPGPKVSAVKFISGDEILKPFASEITAATFPNSFPDSQEMKLLRRGRFTCPHSSETCRLLLESAETIRSVN